MAKEKAAGNGAKAVERRFQTEAAETIFGVLLNLRQTGTVNEYRELFEKLTDVVSIFAFMNGLREDVKAELSTFDTESLSDLMDLASVAEARCIALADPQNNALMKFWGKIEGRRVIIVVSSGSPDSVIAARVVKELRLPTSESRELFAVIDGSVMESGGVCSGLTVKVQGAKMEIKRDFFVLDLAEGADMVLGTDWITGLDSLMMSFGDLTMVAQVAGKQITLKGDPSLTKGIECWTVRRVSGALRVLKHMQDANVNPDAQTFAYLISNCETEEDIIKYRKEMEQYNIPLQN